MTILALASTELCAAALRQAPPATPEDAVRVLVEGSAAMGLPVVCGPWDRAAEVDAVREELGWGGGGSAERLADADTVTAWLVDTPSARSVVAPVSGPLWLAAAAGGEEGEDPQDVLDAAADFVADRVRTLCELGVGHVAVLEASAGHTVEPAAATEAHTPIVRLARHFGVPFTLVALDEGVPAAALGYERWVSPSTGSPDLLLVTADSLREGSGPPATGAADLVTDYLGSDVEPARVRDVVASAGRGLH